MLELLATASLLAAQPACAAPEGFAALLEMPKS